MHDQLNFRIIESKSAFLWYILIVYLAYTIDCVAALKFHVFMQSFWIVKNTFYIEVNAEI